MVVGICDDEKNVRDLLETYIRKLDAVCAILHFENGEDLLKHVRRGKKLDVLYLDIDLNGSPDGMAVAEKLKDQQIKEGIGASALPLIIFVTGLPERMPEAFGVRAFHFLVKPIEEKQFALVFDQAKRAVLSTKKARNGKCISVNSAGAKKTISVSDICYIESKGRKLIIHTNKSVVDIYGAFADIQEDLDDSFFQVHRSFVVNMNCISDYTRISIRTHDGDMVPMSKYKYKDFVKEYARFLEKSE